MTSAASPDMPPATARDAEAGETIGRLAIERLGQRGDGVASGAAGPVFIPFTMPGDVVDATVTNERGVAQTLITPSPDRVSAFCPWFERCGGCATQTLALSKQLIWKHGLVASALAHAGLDARVAACVVPCIDAHGAGRRRATFHARRGDDGRMIVGFMAARSHDLVAIDACPLFAPTMSGTLDAARALATTLASKGKPLDIAVTATDAGLDVDLRGSGPLDDREQAALVAAAERLGVARVSNHGRPVVTFRPPKLRVGGVSVELPPGGFLQATEAGEDVLSRLVVEATAGAKRVADLFSGIGTFALRLAARAEVLAVESDAAALKALLDAARAGRALHAARGEQRDLDRRPLSREELAGFDAVVFDPPRAGAAEQVRELARAGVPVVVGVSCNPQTFARDAKALVEGGYALERVTPVDQFRHSAHVEIVGVFRRGKAKKKRSLLG